MEQVARLKGNQKARKKCCQQALAAFEYFLGSVNRDGIWKKEF